MKRNIVITNNLTLQRSSSEGVAVARGLGFNSWIGQMHRAREAWQRFTSLSLFSHANVLPRVQSVSMGPDN